MTDKKTTATPDAPTAAPETPVPETPTPAASAPHAEGAAAGPVGGEGPAAPPAVPRGRRVGFAVARWAAAVLVCGALGTGTAYGIASLDRTDVPGLATESDGRWDYPRLTLPALPEGRQRPYTDGNRHHIHHADLRDLLLPAPLGATADKELGGGWVTESRYLSEYAEEHRPGLEQALADHGVRHIAARGWTMPDGTATRIYLLRLTSSDMAEEFLQAGIGHGLSPDTALNSAPETRLDESWEWDELTGPVTLHVYDEVPPLGAEHTRQAYIVSGDTLGLVVQSRKGVAQAVPFRQTVLLQSQLLG
ncbi:hypothetical protein [Streptomyces thermolilacinus]|uniref:Uncharacterized protein n=1 Tax=Streptomyces thermolilacinus SPC6 TaxID=1306406 RepID=A0A1D3DSC1_9ACTN|nr:hypothetical protein [Streptomyces thermolilacinus]OEJ95223.1 hypothetical protein J116_012740 [Streptomyces thermolilacinus SPC6]